LDLITARDFLAIITRIASPLLGYLKFHVYLRRNYDFVMNN